MLLFSAVMLYIVRLFNVCVPTVSIPWCYPVSNLVYLNLAMKFAIVICIVLDPDGLYVLIEVVVVFIIQIVQSAYRLLFSPNYEPMVDFVVKSRDFILALSLVIGLGCRIVEDKKIYDLIYMICFAPIITLGWKILESMRNQQILVKLKTKTLKLELEYEYILYTLM